MRLSRGRGQVTVATWLGRRAPGGQKQLTGTELLRESASIGFGALHCAGHVWAASFAGPSSQNALQAFRFRLSFALRSAVTCDVGVHRGAFVLRKADARGERL